MSATGAGTLRLRVEQFAPVLGDVSANLRRVSEAQVAAAADGVGLLVTPELSLTGYDLRDRVHAAARPVGERPFPELSTGPDVVVGLVELGNGFVPYNSALHLRAGEVLHRHRKLYLPTYGMFDEGRYFGAGERLDPYDAGGGWRIGLLICEDLWHPALPYLLAMGGAHLLIVQSAAAGRGAWAGRTVEGGVARYASAAAWEHLVCAAAVAYGVYVVLANRVGVEGPIVFAGGSLIAAPDGTVVARAGDAEEESLTYDLELGRVAAARRPYAHLRDEDVHLVRRELDRLLGSGL